MVGGVKNRRGKELPVKRVHHVWFREQVRSYFPEYRSRFGQNNCIFDSKGRCLKSKSRKYRRNDGHRETQMCLGSPSQTLPSLARRDMLVGSMYAAAGRLIVSSDAAEATMNVKDVEKRLDKSVTQFMLDNQMTFIVRQRRNAPVVSFHTYADVGAYEDDDEYTGMAHLLEHLAFKGSPRIGSLNWQEEKALLNTMDEIFAESRDASGPKKFTLEQKLEKLQEEVAFVSAPNAFGSMLVREGAVGLNAATTHDSTQYYCSMPSNKLELWFAMEAERFQAPVFRDVYSEKKVVLEERNLRVDGAPLGRFQEEYMLKSLSNNYRRPVVGFEEDIRRIGRRDVATFFKSKYGPESLTVTVVGDVDVSKVRHYAEKYFGSWSHDVVRSANCTPLREEPLALPDPSVPRSLNSRSKAGPLLLRSWYRPCIKNKSASLSFDIIQDCLIGSRSSRLQSLVKHQVALNTSCYASFPGEKHSTQFAIYSIPAPGVSIQNLDAAIQSVIGDIALKGPTNDEMQQFLKVLALVQE